MNTYTVTVTSKNQITLPAELVRKFKLARNRKLDITERANGLELKPSPSLRETMQKYHTKHQAAVPLKPEQEHHALAEIVTKKATR